MQVGNINGSSLGRPGADKHPAGADSATPASESRALVASVPGHDFSEHRLGYRNSLFLAHLIATKDQHPQTRERRRADPDEVLAAYRATVALSTP